MHELLNTLYVITQGSYLRLDHDTLRLEVDGETRLVVPIQHLRALVLFGNVMVTPFVLHRFAEEGRSVVLLDSRGRFKGRLEGSQSGNVLLRRGAAEELAILLRTAGRSASLDEIRGFEGQAAQSYFAVFTAMVRGDREYFKMLGRSRRPPRDPINALLSFLYTLLLADCCAAVESVGLDPQIGFLHTLRPGRPTLGLDLVEEFRSIVADRLALTLINRRQLSSADFEEQPSSTMYLSEDGRRTVVAEYQRRKQEEITHPLLNRAMPLGLVPFIQARLLARHLRGDADRYLPFLPK
jgi:CRISPR-associated protein Cas1